MGGSVLVACGLVHLNVAWINDLLRELLDHRLADPKKASFVSLLHCGIEAGVLSEALTATEVQLTSRQGR